MKRLIREYGVEKIVLGFPKHMNSDIGERAEKSLEFRDMLARRTGLEVVMWDERLTTVAAEQTLIESGVRRENRKKYIDKIAAVFILQGYLDYYRHAEAGRRQLYKGFYMEKVKFSFRDGTGEDEFFVLEETKINGAAYILVSDSEDDDGECLILKEVEAGVPAGKRL